MSEKKVTLARYFGGTDQLEIDGHLLVRGQQYEVNARLAKRLEERRDVEVLKGVTPGSSEDQRPAAAAEGAPIAGPDDAPVLVDELAPHLAAESASVTDAPLDPLDDTPHDTPEPKE